MELVNLLALGLFNRKMTLPELPLGVSLCFKPAQGWFARRHPILAA